MRTLHYFGMNTSWKLNQSKINDLKIKLKLCCKSFPSSMWSDVGVKFRSVIRVFVKNLWATKWFSRINKTLADGHKCVCFICGTQRCCVIFICHRFVLLRWANAALYSRNSFGYTENRCESEAASHNQSPLFKRAPFHMHTRRHRHE